MDQSDAAKQHGPYLRWFNYPAFVTAAIAYLVMVFAQVQGDRDLLGLAWIFAVLQIGCSLVATISDRRNVLLLAGMAATNIFLTVLLGWYVGLGPGAVVGFASPFAVVAFVAGIAALVRTRQPAGWENTAFATLLAVMLVAAGCFAGFGAWNGDEAGLAAGWGLGLAALIAAAVWVERRMRGMYPSDMPAIFAGGAVLFLAGIVGVILSLMHAEGWWMLLALPYAVHALLGARALSSTIGS